MIGEPLPRSLKRAIEHLEAEPGRPWRLATLAAACAVAPRTLQKHFRGFVGHTPLAFLRELRFRRARQDLIAAAETATVAEIATRYGFAHLGRFAIDYQRCYGESPSATLRRSRRMRAPSPPSLPVLSSALERPAIAIFPFDQIGGEAGSATAFAEEIATALWRLHWINITAPAHAGYHLRGKVRNDAGGRLRVTLRLLDARTGRHLWAAAFDGDGHDLSGMEERVAIAVTRAVPPALRGAEIDRASRRDHRELTAWDLTMQALPHVISLEAAAQGVALELLDEAMQLAPDDPLPISIAAWSHGLRAGHHFTTRPSAEKAVARELAARAVRLSAGDALAETMLAAGYTLAHDLAAAAIHAERALAFDGGSAWAWGRSAWVKAYQGQATGALEEFQIARALAPADPLTFLCSIGIASAEFQAGRYNELIRWYQRAFAENPANTWANRFLAPAYVLAGRREDGRRTLAEFASRYPGLTIKDVRSGLPWNVEYLDRASEGLEGAGMRP